MPGFFEYCFRESFHFSRDVSSNPRLRDKQEDGLAATAQLQATRPQLRFLEMFSRYVSALRDLCFWILFNLFIVVFSSAIVEAVSLVSVGLTQPCGPAALSTPLWPACCHPL